jgi:2-polyprenyl-6-methoxyphenol hydroxylase-like FAD-dependent oxidoreductase
VSVRLESARKITGRTTVRTDNPLHVLIVGASFGGLALAHGLRRARVSCALYEARCTCTGDRAGSPAAIDAMGVRALRECLPPDVFAALSATGADTPRYPSAAPEWRPLRQRLLTGVQDLVHFGRKFTHYQRRDDGTVTAFFADGVSASGRLLVAADGARSTVRAQYLRELTPRRHLNVRTFSRLTDPAAAFPLQITSAGLAPAWQASNITLLGDAIHAVTPGPCAGANTALRDAMLLSRALSFVQTSRLGLHNAVAAYETEMVRFGLGRVTQAD